MKLKFKCNLIEWILTALCYLWRLLRPTFVVVYKINRRLSKAAPEQTSDEVMLWRQKLQQRSFDERSIAVTTLLALHEMDQNRVQGIVSKAFGVLSLIGISVAGLLALVIGNVIGYYAAIPGFYLLASAASIFFIIEPSPRYIMDRDNIIPIDLAGATLAVYSKLNEPDGQIKNNYTVASLYDTVRAIMATIAVVLISAFV